MPALSTVYLYLTNHCNLNCRHCWINPCFTNQKKEKGMESKLLIDILEQSFALGMRSLKITGGEPLLYDAFTQLLEYLRQKKSGLFLHMETNGILIDKKMAAALKEAGMKFISLSIDGDNPDTHDRMRGSPGSFQKAWQAAREIARQGIPLQIITAVYRGNINQLENIAMMAGEIKAESIKANIVTAMGRGANMSEGNELLSIEEILELNRKIEGEYRKSFKLRFYSSVPVAFRSLKRMLEEKTNFCGIKELLGVLATGKISICGIGEEIEELILGDARIDTIKDIWLKNPILQILRNDLPVKLEGVCKICLFKNRCLGHCVAQSYSRTSSLTASFWLCQEAYARNLFPKSRLLPGYA